MSWQAVKTVLQKSKHAGTAKLVLVSIAEHYNEDTKTAWPGVDTLAGYCNVSRQSIFNALDKLTESGELKIEHKAGPNGVNLYRLPILEDSAQSSQVDSKADLTVKPALLPQSSRLDYHSQASLTRTIKNHKEPNIITTTPQGRLATFYQRQTNNAPKGVTDSEMWEDDCGVILDMAEDNSDYAEKLISEAIIILDDLGYSHKSPGSLVKTIKRQLQRKAKQRRNGASKNDAKQQSKNSTSGSYRPSSWAERRKQQTTDG